MHRLGVLCGWIVESDEEESTEMHCTCAGDGLERGDAPILNGGRLSAEDQLLRRGSEVGKTSNWEVFVVQLGILANDVVGLYAVCQP